MTIVSPERCSWIHVFMDKFSQVQVVTDTCTDGYNHALLLSEILVISSKYRSIWDLWQFVNNVQNKLIQDTCTDGYNHVLLLSEILVI